MNTSNLNSQKHNRTLYFGLDIPFLDHLGVVPEFAEAGKVRISYTVKPEHTNSFHVAQGGVIMTLLDFAMGAAARTASNHQLGAITIDMTTSFLRPSTGKIVVQGTLLKSGKSINYCEAVALNEAGEITAKASGTFILRR
ncbi:thioesterase [Polynucleobacter wuianus]|uniref:Thioesterase n=1 Tax=Polynucleobacter wuianus TaxID=1743168 RepID=A0A191UEF1_9BURK|nr:MULTISPECIES: PaaI family thioesterase [Polynucleobacter]ANI99433.1 thioesterase [Polynucleobacter wuianus]MBU3551957.1 PaaI family thioesterase [Polynucleobacter sp. MWH-Post4-6-1]